MLQDSPTLIDDSLQLNTQHPQAPDQQAFSDAEINLKCV